MPLANTYSLISPEAHRAISFSFPPPLDMVGDELPPNTVTIRPHPSCYLGVPIHLDGLIEAVIRNPCGRFLYEGFLMCWIKWLNVSSQPRHEADLVQPIHRIKDGAISVQLHIGTNFADWGSKWWVTACADSPEWWRCDRRYSFLHVCDP